MSRRLEMILMLFSGIVILYFLRVNMSIASQQMKIDLKWTDEEKGFILVTIKL
jgi:sugar phosphate permease